MIPAELLPTIFSYNKYIEINTICKSLYNQKKLVSLSFKNNKYSLIFKDNNDKYYKHKNLTITNLNDFMITLNNNQSLKINVHYSQKIENEYYEEFAKFNNLKKLDISILFYEHKGEGIEPECYSNLNFNNTAIKYIYELINLEYLNLGGQLEITNIGFKEIYKLKNLKYLNLSYLNISDYCMENYLSKLQKLEYLDLTRNKEITLSGIYNLISKLPNIKDIDISLCNSIFNIRDYMNICIGKVNDDIIKYTIHGHNNHRYYLNNIIGYIEYENRKVNIHLDRNDDYLNYLNIFLWP